MIAVYHGSFDPVHLGHMSVIERAAASFAQVVVLVLDNPAKAHLLSVRQRVELVSGATSHLTNVRGVGHDGLSVDGARAAGAGVLIRNAGKELRQERMMAVTNHRISGIPTVLIPPDPSTAAMSSTFVRALLGERRYDDVASLVPQVVQLALRDL